MSLRHIALVKTVSYMPTAERTLARLAPDVATRIEEKNERYATTGEGDVKALRGQPTLRLRVGDWRVIFTEDLHVIEIVNVGHRSSIYG